MGNKKVKRQIKSIIIRGKGNKSLKRRTKHEISENIINNLQRHPKATADIFNNLEFLFLFHILRSRVLGTTVQPPTIFPIFLTILMDEYERE